MSKMTIVVEAGHAGLRMALQTSETRALQPVLKQLSCTNEFFCPRLIIMRSFSLRFDELECYARQSESSDPAQYQTNGRRNLTMRYPDMPCKCTCRPANPVSQASATQAYRPSPRCRASRTSTWTAAT